VLGHVGSFPRGSSSILHGLGARRSSVLTPAVYIWYICNTYLVYLQYHGAFRTRSTMPRRPGVEPSLFNTFLLVLVFGGSGRGQCLGHELPECLNPIVRIRIRTCMSLIGRSHRAAAPRDRLIALAVPCLRVTMGLCSTAAR
jgi:hypothetical protein